MAYQDGDSFRARESDWSVWAAGGEDTACRAPTAASLFSRHLQLFRQSSSRGEREEDELRAPSSPLQSPSLNSEIPCRRSVNAPLSHDPRIEGVCLGASFYWGFAQLIRGGLLQWSINRGSRQRFLSLPGSETLISESFSTGAVHAYLYFVVRIVAGVVCPAERGESKNTCALSYAATTRRPATCVFVFVCVQR